MKDLLTAVLTSSEHSADELALGGVCRELLERGSRGGLRPGGENLGAEVRNRQLLEQVEICPAGLHRVNDLDGAVVIVQRDQLQDASVRVEPQNEVSLWMVIVQWAGEDWRLERRPNVVVCDAMFPRGWSDNHEAAAHWANAWRIASDRLRCSLSARAMTASSSASVRRTGTTRAARSDRAGRPMRFFSQAMS